MRAALPTIGLLAGLLSGCASDRFPDGARPGSAGLECSLVGPSTCELGTAPELRVEIRNSSAEEILLVRSLDGSHVAYRYPHCSYEVLGPDGESVVDGILGCGNVNALMPLDFVRVPAGEVFDPFEPVGAQHVFGDWQLRGSMFDAPGEYRVKFVYSTDSDDLAEWVAWPHRDGAQLRELLRRVPKARLESPELVVTVVDTER